MFVDKVKRAERAGAVAVVVYDYQEERPTLQVVRRRVFLTLAARHVSPRPHFASRLAVPPARSHCSTQPLTPTLLYSATHTHATPSRTQMQGPPDNITIPSVFVSFEAGAALLVELRKVVEGGAGGVEAEAAAEAGVKARGLASG